METCRETCGGVYCRGIFRNEQIFGCWAEDSPYPPSRESLRNSLLWQVCPQKTKIVSLHWNLVSRPIRIGRFQWWCSLFLFFTRNTLFGQISSKESKIVTLSWDLLPRPIWIWTVQLWWLRFLFSTENTLFEKIWFKKPKLPL